MEHLVNRKQIVEMNKIADFHHLQTWSFQAICKSKIERNYWQIRKEWHVDYNKYIYKYKLSQPDKAEKWYNTSKMTHLREKVKDVPELQINVLFIIKLCTKRYGWVLREAAKK